MEQTDIKTGSGQWIEEYEELKNRMAEIFDPSRFTMLPLSCIEINDGQLPGLPANPRQIQKESFNKLKKDLTDYPEMLGWRTMVVYPLDNGKYILIGGNMRYRALSEMKVSEAPCFIIPKETPVERLQAYTILDNNTFGSWDWDMLGNEWDMDKLEDWGLDMNFKYVDEDEPDDLDADKDDKPFIVKITFKSERQVNEFQRIYTDTLQNEYPGCIISCSGGKL